jgi:hypothetical protein
MSDLDHACNAVDLVTAAVCPVGLAVHGVFVEDLVDRLTRTRAWLKNTTGIWHQALTMGLFGIAFAAA